MPEGIANFIDAWNVWWHASESISRYTLWWLPVLIWARIGKILELVGGLFFLIDWIGRERLAKAAALAVSAGDQLGDVKVTVGGKLTLSLLEVAHLKGTWDTLRTTLRIGAWVVATENRVRALNLTVILVGFMFDLLGS